MSRDGEPVSAAIRIPDQGCFSALARAETRLKLLNCFFQKLGQK